MMLAQAAATCRGHARVIALPVMVGVAPPVGDTLCGALRAGAREGQKIRQTNLLLDSVVQS